VIKRKLNNLNHGFAHRLDLSGQPNFLDGFVDESGSTSPQVNGDDPLDYEQGNYSSDSQTDPFQQGIEKEKVYLFWNDSCSSFSVLW